MTSEVSVAAAPGDGVWRRRFDGAVDRVASSRRWALTTTGVAIVVGVVLASPWYAHLDRETSLTWTVRHIRGPLFDRHVDLLSQEANLQMRIVPRLLGKALHITAGWEVLALQALFGVLLLWVFARLVAEALDRRTAVLLTVATACTWAGATGWLELRGFFDAGAIALVLTAMWVRRPLAIGVLALLATFTDERAAFVLPLVLLWQLVRPGVGAAAPRAAGDAAAPTGAGPATSSAESPVAEDRAIAPDDRRPLGLRALVHPATGALVLALVAHLVIRTWLKHRYGLSEGHNHSPGQPFKQMNNYPNGLFSALEGMWILAAVGLAAFWRRGDRLLTVLAILTTAVSLLIAVSVFDITRSAAYVLPLVPLALVGLRAVPAERRARLVGLATTITVIWPVLYAGGPDKVMWAYPLPIRIARAVLHVG